MSCVLWVFFYRRRGKFVDRFNRLPPRPDAARRAKNCCVSMRCQPLKTRSTKFPRRLYILRTFEVSPALFGVFLSLFTCTGQIEIITCGFCDIHLHCMVGSAFTRAIQIISHSIYNSYEPALHRHVTKGEC